MPEPTPVDVLMVSPGTTAGWRRADAELAALMGELGLSVATAATDFRLARHLRRGVLMTDLAEAAAMRGALTRALRSHRPRAIVYSSPQATMLQPARRLAGATAVRLDEPAATNRGGPGAAILHRLERRSLSRVRLLLPIGLEPSVEVLSVDVDTPIVALPIATELTEGQPRPRERLAVVYAGNPQKKGLELALAAWAHASLSGWRLVVTGIERDAGLRYLARRGVAEPAGVEWPGLLTPERFGELLGSAAVFMSASGHEDYGLAQLEALAAGLVLVTLAAAGPYPALDIARELDPRLVSAADNPESLATALGPALEMSEDQRAAYRERARELLRPYSREEVRRRLEEQVLPVLLP